MYIHIYVYLSRSELDSASEKYIYIYMHCYFHMCAHEGCEMKTTQPSEEWAPVKASVRSMPFTPWLRLYFCLCNLNPHRNSSSYIWISVLEHVMCESDGDMMNNAWPLYFWFSSCSNDPEMPPWATLIATGPGEPSAQSDPQNINDLRASPGTSFTRCAQHSRICICIYLDSSVNYFPDVYIHISTYIYIYVYIYIYIYVCIYF